jgi:GMP synthase (glutamine-hydrolysing)
LQHQAVLVLDFGGQYNQLIARRVRENNVFCEVLPYTVPLGRIQQGQYKGIIFTGGPSSTLAENAPSCDPAIYALGIPILGICYGAQLLALMLGGQVVTPDKREYGHIPLTIEKRSSLFFKDVSERTVCWMSHTDHIARVPDGFEVTATTATCPVAAMEDAGRRFYAVQFHPEVLHTPEGGKMLHNFLYLVCGCTGDWQMSTFVADSIRSLRERIGDRKVLCALSGGVDSSVAAVMYTRPSAKT